MDKGKNAPSISQEAVIGDRVAHTGTAGSLEETIYHGCIHKGGEAG